MSNHYIPDRGDIILLDFEPTKGKEIGKYRPAYVLSSANYNRKLGLLICSPISTSIRGLVTEIPISGLDKPSVIVGSLINTLSWRDRGVKFIRKAEAEIHSDLLQRLLPLIGANDFL